MFDRISQEDDQLILNTDSVSLDDVYLFLESLGCRSPRDLQAIGQCIYLTEPQAWEGRYVPLFPSPEMMWHEIRTRSKKPERIHFVGKETGANESVLQRVSLYFLVREILAALCSNSGDDSRSNSYIFYSSRDSAVHRLEVSYLFGYEFLKSVDVDDVKIDRAQKLIVVVSEDDAHTEARRHIMRELVLERFEGGGGFDLIRFMDTVHDFYREYNERYSVYVSKFSVSKVLVEIENDCVVFLGRMQDAIMEQQTRAFAIPVSVVAVGAILESKATAVEYLVILIGLVILTWMISSLNKNVSCYIYLLVDEYEQSVKKYDRVTSDAEEIRGKIKRSQEKLSSTSTDAVEKLSVLTRVCWLVLVLTCTFLIKRFLDS